MRALSKICANPDVVDRMALGALRFIDAVTGQSITEGLSVVARFRDKTISAVPSPRGVHILHQLPALSRVSFWDGESEPEPDPLSYEYTIEVRDTYQRFFPITFKTRFSSWPEAIPICTGLGSPVEKVQLFSAPWRLPRTDFAVIRGTLWHHPGDKAAAWALLRVYRDADDPATAMPLVEGASGPGGEFMLMFPWPKADPSVLNGPKGLRWTVRIQALYDLPDPQIPEDALPDGERRLPALCSILNQRSAALLAEFGADGELPPQEMTPGQTLLLRTSGEKVLYLK